MKKTEDFLKKLLQATRAFQPAPPTKEQQDQKIKNTVKSWWKNETKGYVGFKNRGCRTDPEFFAHNFARAGVGLKDGWDFTKETLRSFIDAESLDDQGDNWRAYRDEYYRTAFDKNFRDGFEKH